MKEYRLAKENSKKISITEIYRDFEDAYNQVHIRQYYVDKFGLSIPCSFTQEENPKAFEYYTSLIDRINIFKERAPVPTKKRVTQQIYGASLLRRSSDGREIVLQFRKGGQKTSSYTFMSRNVLPLTDGDERNRLSSWYCYRNFYQRPGFNGGTAYYITREHPDWEFFNETMNKNYDSLAGVDYSYKPRVKPTQDQDIRETLEAALIYTGLTPYSEMVKAMEERGLCKFSNNGLSVYDKDGYWAYDKEEFSGVENEKELFLLLEYMDNSSLKETIKVIDKFVEYDET